MRLKEKPLTKKEMERLTKKLVKDEKKNAERAFNREFELELKKEREDKKLVDGSRCIELARPPRNREPLQDDSHRIAHRRCDLLPQSYTYSKWGIECLECRDKQIFVLKSFTIYDFGFTI